MGHRTDKIKMNNSLGIGSKIWERCNYFLFPSQIFHDVAYKAKDRNDLLAGIDEFLDQVTVLPPGEWDPSIRIEPPKSVPSQVSVMRCWFRPNRGC